ncbi:MAG: carbon-nitrogen hydrolase family protein [Rhodothermia bacterium]|nr:carbon-nitrogen hydrolase family protein [Rhodothermia bacterium]
MTGPSRKVRIALIQQSASEDRRANVEKGVAAAETAAACGAQLICFAELAFDRFFPAERPEGDVLELAETVPGETTELFSRVAAEHGVVIVLNLFERDRENTYDTSPVIDADGSLLGRTRMVHITDYPCFHEMDYYTPGNAGAPVFETAVGRVGVAICYDRHYPEYMRALAVGGAELVVIPQAGAVDEWPEGLFEAEMRVASFQNGYFTALCNRVGAEERLTFAGESFVCDPAGRVVARAGRLTEEIVYCDVNLDEAVNSHARRLFLRDRRPGLYADWLGR